MWVVWGTGALLEYFRSAKSPGREEVGGEVLSAGVELESLGGGGRRGAPPTAPFLPVHSPDF